MNFSLNGVNKKWFWGAIILVVLLAFALLFALKTISDKNKEMTGFVGQMTYEKNQIEQEYQDFSKSMDGLQFKTNNDSLAHQIEMQQQHIQSLMQELHSVKATDSEEISRLKKELATVRAVMMHYVAIVDSLNRINAALTTENKEVKQKYVQANQTVQQLSKDKSNLSAQVKLAARLEVKSLAIETLTDRNRKTDKVKKTATIKIDFVIAKNITANPGNRVVYARIMTPDNEVLSNNPNDLFSFENSQIQFSCKKMVEYQGTDLPDVLYWQVNQLLFPGTYRVDLFADGNLIGQQTFVLKK
jgi:FtsZ-binding cell division protein ZapB